jgi:hypothetical protein
MKRWIITGLSFGAGLAITLLLIFGVYSWFKNRPRAWDNKSITANYDGVDTEGDKNTLVFYYTLQNNTDFDYSIDDVAKITLLVKLERQKSLSGGKNDSFLKGDFPLFLPAKQRLRFGIHLGYPYEKKGKDNPSREEQVQYRKEVASYVKNELSNVDGFVLFDEAKRYQVDFPPGW